MEPTLLLVLAICIIGAVMVYRAAKFAIKVFVILLLALLIYLFVFGRL